MAQLLANVGAPLGHPATRQGMGGLRAEGEDGVRGGEDPEGLAERSARLRRQSPEEKPPSRLETRAFLAESTCTFKGKATPSRDGGVGRSLAFPVLARLK